MKRIKRPLTFVITILFTFFTCSSVFAATGYQGMACFRDGVMGGLQWHAGLYYQPNANYSWPIVHIGGDGDIVSRCDLATFNDGNTFKGVYYKSGVTSSKLDSIRYLADELASDYTIGYPYLAFNMLEHSASSGYIYPYHINTLRCDGVVEYCYEYYGVKLQTYYDYNTSTDHWDISEVDDCEWHTAGNGMSPVNQAGLMTRKSTSP